VEFKKLRALLDGLGAAASRFDIKIENISHMLEDMSTGLAVSNRSQILEWISTIPYTSHHRKISEGRLDGTGEWLLARNEYRDWRESSASKLLLLRGIRKLPYPILWCGQFISWKPLDPEYLLHNILQVAANPMVRYNSDVGCLFH